MPRAHADLENKKIKRARTQCWFTGSRTRRDKELHPKGYLFSGYQILMKVRAGACVEFERGQLWPRRRRSNSSRVRGSGRPKGARLVKHQEAEYKPER